MAGTGQPFARVTARLEPIGIPGRSGPGLRRGDRIYVAHLHVPRPGRYWLVAQPTRAKIQALGTLDVTARARRPRRRGQGPAFRHADARDASAAQTHDEAAARPAAPALLGRRLARRAQAVRRHLRDAEVLHEPHLRAGRRRASRRSAELRPSPRHAFIHVEVFRDNDPAKGYNRWMRQWGLRERAVGLPRRARRPGKGEVRGLGLGGRADRRDPRTVAVTPRFLDTVGNLVDVPMEPGA